VGIRTLYFPDGRTREVEANARFLYATTIDIGNIQIIHRHYTLARAEKVAKRLDRIMLATGVKTIIARF
jgi:hypothetical protein